MKYEEVGPLFGRSNMITGGPVAVAEGAVTEADLALARRHLGDRSKIHDMILHGVRVRLFTNSHHLALFARGHFWSAAEWRAETGTALLERPAVQLFAVIGVEGTSRYDSSQRVGLLFNTANFGSLREMILDAAGRVLQEQGVLMLRAAAVGFGEGVGLIEGHGKSSMLMALLKLPEARYHSDGACFVRFDARPMAYPAEKMAYLRADLVADLGSLNLENAGGSEGRALLELPREFGPLEPSPVTCLFRLRERGGKVAETLASEGDALRQKLMQAVPCHAVSLVRPPDQMARLIGRLLHNPPARVSIDEEHLEGYLA